MATKARRQEWFDRDNLSFARRVLANRSAYIPAMVAWAELVVKRLEKVEG